MIAWLLLRPKMIAGIGALALVLSLWGAWKWEVRGLKKQIATLTDESRLKDVQIANQGKAIAQERVNVKDLEGRIIEQNAAIQLWQLKAEQAETAKSLAASRAFNQGRAAAVDILNAKVPTPSNHEEATKAVNAILDMLRTP